jgi:putative membrane protein insertion efficiency factor
MDENQKNSARTDPFALVFKGIIHLYRYTLSFILGRQCRHAPTCSEYALESIERFGSWRGSWLALSRIMRCHPWGSHGLDPVPEKLEQEYRFWQGWKYGRWSPSKAMLLAEQEVKRQTAPQDEKKQKD